MKQTLIAFLLVLSLSTGLHCEAARTIEVKKVNATVTLPTGWTTQDGLPPHAKTIVKENNRFLNPHYTIASLAGTLTLKYQDGTSITISAGTGLVMTADGKVVKNASGNAVRSLGDLLKADTSGNLRASITNAITDIAKEIATGGGDAAAVKDSTTQLAAIMKTMSQVDPTGTPALVQAAVAALTTGGSSSKNVTNAISAVVAGATSNPSVSTGGVEQAAVSGAKINNVTLAQSVYNATSARNTVDTGDILNNSATTQIDVTTISPSS